MRFLHRHKWRTVVAQQAHDFGMGQEMATGTVRQCRTCYLCDWDTFVVVAPTVCIRKRERTGRQP